MSTRDAGQHEQQVVQAVQVAAGGGAQILRRTQRQLFPLGRARHGFGHVGLRGAAGTGRQDEFGQRRQAGVVVDQGLVQLELGAVLEQRRARHVEFATQADSW